MKREQVYEIIDGEREYQDAKWDNKAEEGNNPSSWILWMEEYLAEARKLASTTSEADPHEKMMIMDKIRKVTALGVAAMEHNGAPFRDVGEIEPQTDDCCNAKMGSSLSEIKETEKSLLNEWNDISNELERNYVYRDGSVLKVKNPMQIKITRKMNEVTGEPIDSHRIISSDGRATYVKPGWDMLYWYSKSDNPFLF